MNTQRNSRPLRLVDNSVLGERKSRRNKPLAAPERDLDSAQKAMRLICEEAFDGNMTAMGDAIGKTQPSIRRFIIEGSQSPKYSELQEWAAMVGVTAEALIAWVNGDIFVAGEWVSRDDPDFEDRRLELIRYLSTKFPDTNDDAADLDDL